MNGLTETEHTVLELLAEAWNLLVSEVVADGPSRDGDLAEIAADVHRLQARVMSQAAGRAHPDLYRMLGGELGPGAIARDEPCKEQLHSWSYFQPEQVDSYWMSCDRLGAHDEHKNSDTGAHWRLEPANAEPSAVEADRG